MCFVYIHHGEVKDVSHSVFKWYPYRFIITLNLCEANVRAVNSTVSSVCHTGVKRASAKQRLPLVREWEREGGGGKEKGNQQVFIFISSLKCLPVLFACQNAVTPIHTTTSSCCLLENWKNNFRGLATFAAPPPEVIAHSHLWKRNFLLSCYLH